MASETKATETKSTSGSSVPVSDVAATAADSVLKRALGAVFGSIVGDAASRPVHWVYNQEHISKFIATDGGGEPAFVPISRSPYYSVPTGEHSPYGDCALAMLTLLTSTETGWPTFTADAFARALAAMFGPGTTYAEAVARRIRYKASPETASLPVEGPWRDSSATAFLANYDAKAAAAAATTATAGAGAAAASSSSAAPATATAAAATPAALPAVLGSATSLDTNGMCAVIPLIAVQAITASGRSEAEEDAEVLSAITVISANPAHLDYFLPLTRIIRNLIRTGGTIEEAFRAQLADARTTTIGRDAMTRVLGLLATPYATVAPTFGIACPNPAAFLCATHAALTSPNYTTVVRRVIAAGGCNCSRIMVAGAMHGAFGGIDVIPTEWQDKSTRAKALLTAFASRMEASTKSSGAVAVAK